jgi:ribosomal-protein-alanine N-acetyltransferase
MKWISTPILREAILVSILWTYGSPVLAQNPLVACSVQMSLLDPAQALPTESESVELTTNRLSLRPLGLSDYKEAARVILNKNSMKMSGENLDEYFIGEILYSAVKSVSQVKKNQRAEFVFGVFLNDRMIGSTVLSIMRFSGGGVYNPTRTEAELGYTFLPSYWGQGFATEATKKVVEFAFATMQTDILKAVVSPGNLASLNVLRKIGLNQVRSFDPKVILLTLKRDDYFKPAH